MRRLIRFFINAPSYLRRLLFPVRHASDDLVEERWEMRCKRPKSRRFFSERGDGYTARVDEDGVELTTDRTHIFAWVDDPMYRYRNFVLTAEIELENESSFKHPTDPDHTQGAGISAAGMLFRKLDDRSFYDLLFSTAGFFRFDVVFNGNQIPLIGWTRCPGVLPNRRFLLRIVARDTRFAIFIDEDWVGEMVDDRLSAGGIAFALQNYGDRQAAGARLHTLTIDSRPVEVEAAWYRWSAVIPVDPDRRVSLARTLLEMGQFSAAGSQLRKAQSARNLSPDEQLLLATCRLESGFPERALESIDAALEADPEYVPGIVEKANVLYLENRFLDLKTHLEAHLGRFDDLPGMWNLLGNCHYALGQWADAETAYLKAIEIQNDAPLFHANLGRTLERRGDTDGAISAYATASRLLFREESYEELERILARLAELAPEHPEIASLEGKIAFHDGDLETARKRFEELVSHGTGDSSVHYLLGVIEASCKDRISANRRFERALELEEEVPIYRFRYAENRYLSGMPCEEAVEHALELGPDDPWCHNLAGLVDLDADRIESATRHFRRAHSLLEESGEITANLAEALAQSGLTEEAETLLRARADEPECANALGKLLARTERLEEAEIEFRRAIALGHDTDFRENLAAVCLETDRILEAEETLATLLETDPTASRYNLMAHVARAKGETRRAESAYLEAASSDPANPAYPANLVDLYLSTRNYDSASEILDTRLAEVRTDRVDDLRRRLHEATHQSLSCAGCGRSWSVPKDLPPQPRMRLVGELPDESPAGICGSCGRIYCIACAREHLREGRFYCEVCNEPLKLSDDRVKYLAGAYVE